MSVIRRRSPVAADTDLTRSGSSAGVRRGGRRHVGRTSSWARRAIRGSMIVAAGTAALAIAGPYALRPFVDAAGAAGSAGEVSVAFVLDFGGSPDREVTGCVSVPTSDNDYDALAAFTAEHGLLAPTYNSVDLLCSINGVPSSGCGQEVGTGYIYWSYFTGGPKGWVYSNTGAFGSVVKQGGQHDVEGWRFQDPGTGRPNDPPPRTAPEFDVLCANTVSTTTTAPAGPGGGPGPAPGAAVATKTRSHPDTKTKGAHSAKSTTTTTTISATTTSTSLPDATTSLPAVSIPPDPEAGLASVAAKHDPPGAGPDPLILGGILVAVLAIAAYARWRRRPRTP